MHPISALLFLVGTAAVAINILGLISHVITGIGEGSGMVVAMSLNIGFVFLSISAVIGAVIIFRTLGDFIPYAVRRLSDKDKNL